MSEPTRAPNAVPRPPRVTAANMSSRICAPMSHLMPGAEVRPQDAGEAGECRRDDPDDAHHARRRRCRMRRPATGCRRSRGSPCRCGRRSARARTPTMTTMQMAMLTMSMTLIVHDAEQRDLLARPSPAAAGVAAADEELEDVAQREREADAHDHELHDARPVVDAGVARWLTSRPRPSAAVSDDGHRDASPERHSRAPMRPSSDDRAEGHHLGSARSSRCRSCRTRARGRPPRARASGRSSGR